MLSLLQIIPLHNDDIFIVSTKPRHAFQSKHVFQGQRSTAPNINRAVAHQCAAKGRHKSTWKFFRSLNLMAASMYTKSIHRETVGRQTPLSEKKVRKRCYKKGIKP